MTTTPNLANVAPPADAGGKIEDWTDWDDDEYERLFTSWTHPAREVKILGLQSAATAASRGAFAAPPTPAN